MESNQSIASHSLKTENYIIWIVSITVVVLGIVMSTIPILDRDWLARAGAVVVMMGIWSGIGGIIRYSILREKLATAKRRGEMRAQTHYQKDPEELEKILSDLNQQYINDAESLRSELSITIGMQEAVLLLSGTILWGFGDLYQYLF